MGDRRTEALNQEKPTRPLEDSAVQSEFRMIFHFVHNPAGSLSFSVGCGRRKGDSQ